ncbi:MAG: hypothetical protein JWN96_2679 [Mycobacterium sp.]|nr:hypothetical protein [Mycobacterium sp.]
MSTLGEARVGASSVDVGVWVERRYGYGDARLWDKSPAAPSKVTTAG